MAMNEGLVGFRKSIMLYRTEHNMTQNQFAEFIGYSVPVVKRWESGMNGPKTKELIEIADKLGLTVDELLRGIKPQNVSIHNETGLSEETIEILRKRDSVTAFYIESIIEPLIQRTDIPFDILAMAAKDREDDTYAAMGIRWSMLETFAGLIDKAVEKTYTGSGDKFIDDLVKNERMLSVYRDFGGILQSESEDNQK